MSFREAFRGVSLRTRLLVGAASFALAAGAFAAGWAANPGAPANALGFGAFRVGIINAHLREVSSPYAFLAGDSYIELHPAERPPCELDVVNGGLSGYKTADYLAALDKIRFETPPAAILLAIGTNDLLRKHEPSRPEALARLRADAEALVGRLAATGARLVVAAVPPIPAALETVFDPPAFKLLSDVLRDACARHACRFVDPYAAARSEVFWRGREGTSRDGLHVSGLRAAYRSVAPALCGSAG
ncbi:SGNH/GDSL hydrolase family protein [Enterovirga sp.]|jgi:lysophospholipase L1-like esterase|uniref:SGNH/GDSL hydrolase family protein n=1 Tax=Enterovirga sp. TaxID=2026350 RepID=UPI00260584B3|nr:SGNH/GDSL hydrolase family protein [Enterovirga sp.]MDB5591312.1 family lipase [Enterovirga sp.]